MSDDHRIDHDVITDSAVVVVMNIGTADADGGDLDQNLAIARLGLGPVLYAQIAGGVQHSTRVGHETSDGVVQWVDVVWRSPLSLVGRRET